VGVILHGLRRALVEALLVTVGASVLALVVNAARPGGLPLVADRPYETLVPCPEPGGEVTALAGVELSTASDGSFVVDARAVEAFRDWSFPGATSIPFDYLEPTPAATLEQLARDIARSRARRVVVYGDGEQPDSGEQLGKEIAASGIKNVFFVEGGAPVLRGVADERSAP